MQETLLEDERNARTITLLGEDKVRQLNQARMAVFGLGGVGAACAEALARCGVGRLTIVDKDRVSVSNLNRQLLSTSDCIGEKKTEVLEKRLKSVYPDIQLDAFDLFYLPENADEVPLEGHDFVLDCVDNISAKIELALRCQVLHIPLLSCMGTGNRLDPFQFAVGDLFETSGDPLARVMRHELRKRGITALKVLFSKEKPVETGLRTPASISFVPPVAGMMMASEAVRSFLKLKN